MRRRLALAINIILTMLLASAAQGQVSEPQATTQIQKTFVLGRQIAKELERSDGLINDPAIANYVQQLANRLTGAAGEAAIEVRITRGSDWYASLLPQRVLYISGSLLERIENEAELAGLLAHELAHLQRTIAPAQSQVLLPLCVLASQVMPTAWSEGRRESEESATAAAVSTLRNAGYEPSAVLDLFSKLAYERPAWAKAISPEDLLTLRASLEAEIPPASGYRIDSSEFMRQHARVAAALGHADSNRSARNRPTLTRR